MSIKLYHVSFDLSEPLHKEFVPKVPNNLINEEDEDIPRICFSDSIQGCIRAISGYPKRDSDCARVIVWEHEFQKGNNLYDWQYLYENNLVPDAAVTHEYWYTHRITLDGALYMISNMEHRILYLFRSTYEKDVLQILSEYVDDLTIFDRMDSCFIINEWVSKYMPLYEVDIISRMKKEILYDVEKRRREIASRAMGEIVRKQLS